MSTSSRVNQKIHVTKEEDTKEKPLLLSVSEAAHLLGIGKTYAWEMVHQGLIPTKMLGKRVLVPRYVVENLAHLDEIDVQYLQ